MIACKTCCHWVGDPRDTAFGLCAKSETRMGEPLQGSTALAKDPEMWWCQLWTHPEHFCSQHPAFTASVLELVRCLDEEDPLGH